jgi:toxin YoeB
LDGYWSRRIDETNRVVYRLSEGGLVEINELRTHYGEK